LRSFPGSGFLIARTRSWLLGDELLEHGRNYGFVDSIVNALRQ
jgi:hypothetical protein